MKLNFSRKKWFYPAGVLLSMLVLISLTCGTSPVSAAGVGLVINGVPVTTTPEPFIQDGRTLVPVRLISEKLGAAVDWNNDTRQVTITKEANTIKLRIDNRLVDLPGGDITLTDVPPRIYSDRTFVPLRLIATALGVSVSWEQSTSTVYVDSRGPATGGIEKEAVLTSIKAGQTISNPIGLQLTLVGDRPAGAAEVRYQLLDPATGKGPIVSRGSDLTAAYTLLPDPFYSGARVLAAGIYDQDGNFLAGDAVPVVMAPDPRPVVAGVTPNEIITGPVKLFATLNFAAASVKYELTNPATGDTKELGSGDPYGQFGWEPQWADNGGRNIIVTAYDRLGQAYVSPPLPVTINVPRSLTLTGVKAGAEVSRTATLGVKSNFAVNSTQYIMRDPVTGTEVILAQSDGAAGYSWLPIPSQSGWRELLAVVTDYQGNIFRSDPIAVDVKGDPKVFLQTIGPNQVLNGSVSLQISANMPLAQVEYQLINPKTNAVKVIAGGPDAVAEYTWTPAPTDDGNWNIRARAITAAGDNMYTDSVPVRVYTGTLYGPKPIIEKSQFQGFASDLAVKTMKKTGMSAALQVAQAILETGWGQSSPVDKYTGQISNNLFGIKGTGSAGSVTSNTWEEYNGVTYRIDAAFRAYYSASESWDDHQDLLLTKSWYGPFREVMFDSTQGAWALRRCGYATDSQYPVKLIDIIKRNGLYKLDEVDI